MLTSDRPSVRPWKLFWLVLPIAVAALSCGNSCDEGSGNASGDGSSGGTGGSSGGTGGGSSGSAGANPNSALFPDYCIPAEANRVDPDFEVTGPTINIQEAPYNARGDGKTNDTDAFSAAARDLNAAGGGKLLIPEGTYIVSYETHDDEAGGRYWETHKTFVIDGLSSGKGVDGLIIEGQGKVVLRAPEGMHYGAFDPVTGERYDAPDGGFYDSKYAASGPATFFYITGSKNVIIRNLELDGNSETFVVGGHFGDKGIQLTSTGIFLLDNTNVLVEDVYTHHHGLDGVLIGYYDLDESSPPTPHMLLRVRSEYNGRQGLSWIGGIGLTVVDSIFAHTGLSPNESAGGTLMSPPGAGVDIEAESVARQGLFCGSEFVDNVGVGMVADMGDSAELNFRQCTMWGRAVVRPNGEIHRRWALWPQKPYILFEDCIIRGSVVNAFADSEKPERATRFERCLFEDKRYDPSDAPSSYLVELNPRGGNIRFKDCDFVVNEGRSVWIDTNRSDYDEGRDHPFTFIEDSVFVHRNVLEPDVEQWVGQFDHVALSGVRFEEDYPSDFDRSFTINTHYARVDKDVHVDGPVLSWCLGPAGQKTQGDIEPGTYDCW